MGAMNLSDAIQRIERTAPLSGAASWDKCGVQILGTRDTCAKLAVALDPAPLVMESALSWGADLVLTHHPLSLEPRFLDADTDFLRVARQFLTQGAWLYAAHTSLDVNPQGPAGWLARELDLKDPAILDPTVTTAYVVLRFDMDEPAPAKAGDWPHLASVLDVSGPSNGQMRITCGNDAVEAVKARISRDLSRVVHFELLQTTLDPMTQGFGLVGDLNEPLAFQALLAKLENLLGQGAWAMIGPELGKDALISRLAYCPGSGGSAMARAAAKGADIYITGDVRYHAALEAPLPVLDVGHFSLEEEMMRCFARELGDDPAMGSVEVRFFTGSDPRRVIHAAG